MNGSRYYNKISLQRAGLYASSLLYCYFKIGLFRATQRDTFIQHEAELVLLLYYWGITTTRRALPSPSEAVITSALFLRVI